MKLTQVRHHHVWRQLLLAPRGPGAAARLDHLLRSTEGGNLG